jgi:hypothetical protein
MARVTRIKPAPLAYPNGGGLKAMGTARNKERQLEVALHEAKMALDRHRIDKKYTAKPSAGSVTPKTSTVGRTPKKPEGA